MSRIVLDAGLSKRFKHVEHIREGTSTLDHIYNDQLYYLEDNLEVLFGNVVRALDKENDFLKVYIRDVLPAESGNAAPFPMNDSKHGTHSVGGQTKITGSANSLSASSGGAQPTAPVETTDAIISDSSGNQNDSTPVKTISSKRSQKTPINPPKFPCTSCGKRFTRSTTLREHMRSHSNERPYHCPDCPKKFARLKDQKRHQELHSTEREYVCNYEDIHIHNLIRGCGRRFSREDGLLAHWRTKIGRECLTRNLDLAAVEEWVFPFYRCKVNWDEPIQCTKALDVILRWRRDQPVHGYGCEKSYRSANDHWYQHICLEEGKECLREILILIAQNESRLRMEAEREAREIEDKSKSDP